MERSSARAWVMSSVAYSGGGASGAGGGQPLGAQLVQGGLKAGFRPLQPLRRAVAQQLEVEQGGVAAVQL